MYKDRWFCGRSKTIVQIISWLQTILNFAALSIGIVGCVLYFGFGYEYLFWSRKLNLEALYHPEGYSKTRARKEYTLAMAVWFGLCILENLLAFISGLVLLLGVRQGDARKLQVWLWIIPFVLLISCTNVAYVTITMGENHSVPRLVIFLLYYFCIWPVLIHKRELLYSTVHRKNKEKLDKANFHLAAYKPRNFSVSVPHDIKL